MADGTPTLLVAQPGGTFMRIKCHPEDCHSEDETHETNNETAADCVDYQTLGISRMRNQNISTEIIGDLECVAENKALHESKESVKQQNTSSEDKSTRSTLLDIKGNSLLSEVKNAWDKAEEHKKSLTVENKTMSKEGGKANPGTDQVDGNVFGGNVILGSYDTKSGKESLLPTYKDFSWRDNNNGNNVESSKGQDELESNVDTKESSSHGKSYALATLDGTIMLVKDEVILW